MVSFLAITSASPLKFAAPWTLLTPTTAVGTPAVRSSNDKSGAHHYTHPTFFIPSSDAKIEESDGGRVDTTDLAYKNGTAVPTTLETAPTSHHGFTKERLERSGLVHRALDQSSIIGVSVGGAILGITLILAIVAIYNHMH